VLGKSACVAEKRMWNGLWEVVNLAGLKTLFPLPMSFVRGGLKTHEAAGTRCAVAASRCPLG